MPTVLGLTNKSAGPGSGPHVSSSTTMGSNARLDTISKRNYASAREMETLLWRALCDEPETLKEYLAHDCIMINPLFAGTGLPLNKDTHPNVVEALQSGGRRLTGFRFHGDPLVVEVDLMAVALVYKISVFRHSRKGIREIVASASSTWRQTAGADWLLVALHVAYADDEEG
ncbi:hypothetical protein C8A05DRAFT_42393 [Staphylotrichum tortipilum]|uniref:DUF4440 domain-containing protein n=1 Tax=Staphylotrichum tortipilum TaxID=2831512 RepID=A0AAN6MQG3_9PEZI|nr:hypothetical protein C8A05DRAFT_42393 [Staphylotrichum longicolle]